MRYFRSLCLLLPILATPAAMAAEVVYEQPAGSAGTWASDVRPSGAGFQTFDNFSLAQASSIGSVTWRGGNLDLGGDGPVPLDTTSFRLSFWSNAAGAPGAALFSVDVAFADVIATFQGEETATGAALPLDVYEFEADLGGSFAAAAGTTYWFSVLSMSPTSDPTFVWRSGTGGDGNSYQVALSSGGVVTDSFVRGGDRAFSLVEVPEPESAALLLGMTGMGWLLARRRRA